MEQDKPLQKSEVILIIDDEEQIRNLLGDCLKAAGYQTVYAENGLNGLNVVQTINISLIICDIRMPVMSGLEFLEKVKVFSPDIPIVMISGFIPTPDQLLSISTKAVVFLKKPFSLNTLLKVVELQLNTD